MIAAESVKLLRSRRVRLEPGLSAREFSAIQTRFGIEFSPDHRDFLSLAVPRGPGWIDWRADDGNAEAALAWPVEGVLFDVAENSFWPPSWGEAPEDSHERVRHARAKVAGWPVLVPLYGHRYLPAAPAGPNAPVFSVWQSDVIVYGRNLLDYVQREFGRSRKRRTPEGLDPRSCPPWSLLAFGLEDEIDT